LLREVQFSLWNSRHNTRFDSIQHQLPVDPKLNPWGLHQVGPHGGPGHGVEIGSWSHDIPHLSQTWLLEIPGTSFSS
jgi:hypothetical protein